MNIYQPIFDQYNKQFESLLLNANNVEVVGIELEDGDDYNAVVELRVDRAVNSDGDIDPVLEKSPSRYVTRHVQVERFDLFSVATKPVLDALSAAIVAAGDPVIENGKFSAATVNAVIVDAGLREQIVFLEGDIDIVPLTIGEEDIHVIVAKEDSLGFTGRITLGKSGTDPEPEIPIEELDWVSASTVINVTSVLPDPATHRFVARESLTIQYSMTADADLRALVGVRAAEQPESMQVIPITDQPIRLKKGGGSITFVMPAILSDLPAEFKLSLDLATADHNSVGIALATITTDVPPPPEKKEVLTNADLRIASFSPDPTGRIIDHGSNIYLNISANLDDRAIHSVTYGAFYNGQMVERIRLEDHFGSYSSAIQITVPQFAVVPENNDLSFQLIDKDTSTPLDVPFLTIKVPEYVEPPIEEPEVPIEEVPWIQSHYDVAFMYIRPHNSSYLYSPGEEVTIEYGARAHDQKFTAAVKTESGKVIEVSDVIRLKKGGGTFTFNLPTNYNYYIAEQLKLVCMVEDGKVLSDFYSYANMQGAERDYEFITPEDLAAMVFDDGTPWVQPNESHAYKFTGDIGHRRMCNVGVEFKSDGLKYGPTLADVDLRNGELRITLPFEQSMPVGVEMNVDVFVGGEDFEATKKRIGSARYNTDPSPWATWALDEFQFIKVTNAGESELIPEAISGTTVDIYINYTGGSTPVYVWLGIPEIGMWEYRLMNPGESVNTIMIPPLEGASGEPKIAIATRDKNITLRYESLQITA